MVVNYSPSSRLSFSNSSSTLISCILFLSASCCDTYDDVRRCGGTLACDVDDDDSTDDDGVLDLAVDVELEEERGEDDDDGGRMDSRR